MDKSGKQKAVNGADSAQTLTRFERMVRNNTRLMAAQVASDQAASEDEFKASVGSISARDPVHTPPHAIRGASQQPQQQQSQSMPDASDITEFYLAFHP